MLVMILAVLCSAMLLVTVIAVGKYMEMTHHANSLQRSVDIYTARSARDWKNIQTLLRHVKEHKEFGEFAMNDAKQQRERAEMYQNLYSQAVMEKKTHLRTIADLKSECKVLEDDLRSYVAKFEAQ